jgi:hypothetical protein
MAARDRARSDLYLAQLRMQSAPNTPGLPGGMLSPRDGGWRPPMGFDTYNEDKRMEEGGMQYAVATPTTTAPKAFALKAPPKSRTARVEETEKGDSTDEDEPVYGAVTVPGAYSVPNSPGAPPSGHGSLDSRLKK